MDCQLKKNNIFLQTIIELWFLNKYFWGAKTVLNLEEIFFFNNL